MIRRKRRKIKSELQRTVRGSLFYGQTEAELPFMWAARPVRWCDSKSVWQYHRECARQTLCH
jgi:hypothetical protein